MPHTVVSSRSRAIAALLATGQMIYCLPALDSEPDKDKPDRDKSSAEVHHSEGKTEIHFKEPLEIRAGEGPGNRTRPDWSSKDGRGNAGGQSNQPQPQPNAGTGPQPNAQPQAPRPPPAPIFAPHLVVPQNAMLSPDVRAAWDRINADFF